MISRVLVTLVIGLCALSLAMHFAVESLGEIQIHLKDGHMAGGFDSHEGDQFVLSEAGRNHAPGTGMRIPHIPKLEIISRPLPPPLQPPKAG